MPNLTLTVEDTSPLLVYSNEWAPGTSRNDTLIELYSQSSYMFTDTGDASVFFVFSGTNVNIYGGKRPRNGFYQIAVDTKVYTPVDGKSNEPGLFQTSLFSSIPLSNAPHTVQLKNANAGSVVDLDYVTWTAPVGRDDEQLITNTFDDNDPSFTYEPADAWTTNPNNLGTFSGGSGHASSKSGSTMKFTFEGDAVSLYGPVGADGALYAVSVDVGNGLPNNYTTKKTFYRPNQMLYHANKLGPGRHTVALTVLAEYGASGESSTLAIDYAQVYTTPSLGGQRLTVGGSPQALSTGAVVGITLGAAAGFIALVGIVIWGILCYVKQRHNRSFFYGFAEKPKSEKDDEMSVRPFQYNTVPSGSPPPTQQTLLTQASHGSLVTTPNTGQWPHSAGQDSIETSVSQRPLLHQTSNPNVQEIIVPPAGMSEKMRRELAPRLQAPPQGARPRQNPAALGAQHHNMSTVQEESATGGSNAPNLTVVTDSDDPSFGSLPPPEYTQQASAIPSTTASSFYAREAYRGH